MARTFERQTFRTSRMLEYFSEKELVLQTGHKPDRWAEVVVKELVDNALDAAEEQNQPVAITVTIRPDAITVADNGPGLPADLADQIRARLADDPALPWDAAVADLVRPRGKKPKA